MMLKTYIFTFLYSLFCLFPAYAIYNGDDVSRGQKERTYRIKFEQHEIVLNPCSGTVISNYTILTAAHCVDKLDLDFDIFVHSDSDRFEIESIYIPLKFFAAQRSHRSAIGSRSEIYYHRALALYDIAVVNLKRPLLNVYKKVDLVFSKTLKDASVTCVGTGYVSYNHENDFFYNNPVEAHGRKLILDILGNGVYFIKGKSFSDYITTPGDSGGPMFLGNSNKQIAVLRGSSATLNESASIYTPVYLHEKFIVKYSK